ncbi:hypothetical protein CcarbDRAFT_4764 [Clostridium carboxidivorans P7]|uniref:Uncharacterized protein n=1 Tax=Clostridium carboxidivorans P7 TaxID=536227 RepID=C6Q147_9CLOT|nr:hypothetical protein CcarbDRAFT_4764 [Clostridium carboxidivorans P7]
MYRNKNYKEERKILSKEEKFEFMLQDFMKISKEKITESNHKKHTVSEQVETKKVNNERRKRKNDRKNNQYKY